MRDNGRAAACGGAAGAAGDGCALFRFASFLNNAALAHAIGSSVACAVPAGAVGRAAGVGDQPF